MLVGTAGHYISGQAWILRLGYFLDAFRLGCLSEANFINLAGMDAHFQSDAPGTG